MRANGPQHDATRHHGGQATRRGALLPLHPCGSADTASSSSIFRRPPGAARLPLHR